MKIFRGAEPSLDGTDSVDVLLSSFTCGSSPRRRRAIESVTRPGGLYKTIRRRNDAFRPEPLEMRSTSAIKLPKEHSMTARSLTRTLQKCSRFLRLNGYIALAGAQ